MKKIEEITSTNASGCILVRGLAKELKMDERTTRAHLEICELHKVGTFTGPDRRTFCTKQRIEKLAEKVGLETHEKE